MEAINIEEYIAEHGFKKFRHKVFMEMAIYGQVTYYDTPMSKALLNES